MAQTPYEMGNDEGRDRQARELVAGEGGRGKGRQVAVGDGTEWGRMRDGAGQHSEGPGGGGGGIGGIQRERGSRGGNRGRAGRGSDAQGSMRDTTGWGSEGGIRAGMDTEHWQGM